MVPIDATRHAGVIKKASVQQVIVDTTVMFKAVAHPTGSRLLEKSREHLVKVAKDDGLCLRQNYSRVALRSRVGRVHQDVQRQIGALSETALAKV